MPVDRTISARHLTRLALLVSLGSALHWMEGFLPPLPVPGARLGLANLVTIVALFTGGPGDALAVAALRSCLASLLGGRFLGLGFAMSLAGGLTSAILMSALARVAATPQLIRNLILMKPIGTRLIWISMAGGLAHNLAQAALAYAVIGVGILGYLPQLVLLGLAAGLAIGTLARPALHALVQAFPLAPASTSAPKPLAPEPGMPTVVLGLVAILAGAFLLWAVNATASHRERLLVVELRGETIATVPLQPRTPARFLQVELPGTGGYRATIEIRGGHARILPIPKEFCPRGICSHTGWISRPGQAAICLPNRLVIRVVEPVPGQPPL